MYWYQLDFLLSKQFKIAPSHSSYLKKQKIVKVKDLFEFYPTRYQDRSVFSAFPINVREGESMTLSQKGKVIRHEYFTAREKKVLKIYFANQDHQEASFSCFNRSFLSRTLPVGSSFYIYGNFNFSFGEWNSASFDIEKGNSAKSFGKIFPLYRGQVSPSPSFSSFLEKVLSYYQPILSEDIPLFLKEEKGLFTLKEALKEIHFPSSFDNLEKARKTLLFREVFWLKAEIAYKSSFFKKDKIPISLKKNWSSSFISSLPFPLTEAQEDVINEIYQDLNSPRSMYRLLQGDVGVGKTLVALISALPILEAGLQVAFMAPTELLAYQHFLQFREVLSPFSVRVEILKGSLKKEEKEKIKEELKEGVIHLVVGTHSLFSESVEFKDLAYIIVDEQHKFGTLQRKKLVDKGVNPHVLLMSATPIPRTLSLALLGDTSQSIIKSYPKNRIPITTYLVEKSNRERVFSFMEEELKKGHLIYFVHPRIEENNSDKIQESIYDLEILLKNKFPNYKIGMLHSQIKEKEKSDIMNGFTRGDISILLGTTMVEVGLDNSKATVMVINESHYLGLASLHQLRGRVGRGSLASYCFLIYSDPLSEEAKERLKALRYSLDGFLLAEKDLQMRGFGNFQDDKQAGRLTLKLAESSRDLSLFLEIGDKIKSLWESSSEEAEVFRLFLSRYLEDKLKEQEIYL